MKTINATLKTIIPHNFKNLVKKTIDAFIYSKSMHLFKQFDMKIDFLNEDLEIWNSINKQNKDVTQQSSIKKGA